MGRTTIEIDADLRDRLREERKPHESNYGETIARLLDSDTGGQLWTEQELRDMIDRRIEEKRRR
jgi:hypothetical protein